MAEPQHRHLFSKIRRYRNFFILRSTIGWEFLTNFLFSGWQALKSSREHFEGGLNQCSCHKSILISVHKHDWSTDRKQFKSALDIQVEHAKKVLMENQLLRSKFTAVLKQQNWINLELILFRNITCARRGRTYMGTETGPFDTATRGGPSGFGRWIGAAVFGSN